MRNFAFFEVIILSVSTLGLRVKLDDKLVNAIEIFARAMILAARPSNTVRAYIRHVAKYLDFFVEMTNYLLRNDPRLVSHEELFEYYIDALRNGAMSTDPNVVHVVETLQWKRVKDGTINAYLAALTEFFTVSERYFDSKALSYLGSDVGVRSWNTGAFPRLQYAENKSDNNLRRINRQSAMAGCIAGGIGLVKRGYLQTFYSQQTYWNYQSTSLIYLDLIPLIRCVLSLRDRCLYYLLVASGMRVSEALQILRADIDPIKREVRVENPKGRKEEYYRMGLTAIEVNSLVFKGRKNNVVFMVEPYAELFWCSYEELLNSSDFPLFRSDGKFVTHDFVFSALKGDSKGKPLCLTCRSAIRKTFKRNFQTGDQASSQHIHALRHAWVTYVCNDHPAEDGSSGLGVDLTCEVIGHSNTEVTAVYNHTDILKLQKEATKAYQVMEFWGSVDFD
ncbi:tyrosine-type recombinase/integrase [Pseudomonas sp. WPR_5_2]|uniref:tyrosine-type recombinase/integrase n=1 Tax=Pseudomonas sp. WPR_5_2 TaxID=1907371 RepID=UPI000EB3C0FB|nr:tyrosine-type recombinase/integrase [Pseudomonas sp. WPR_5_2]